MPPVERFVCRFVAEPPQGGAPYGRHEERLREQFLDAVKQIDSEGEDLGEPGEIVFYPDRTWFGRTYVPATTRSSAGFELFGFVTLDGEGEPISATAEFTEETADANPDWQLDLCDEVVGSWRGEQGKQAQMTLVWGRPLLPDGVIVTAELTDLAVDQCVLIDGRFTLLAPDAYRSDYLDIILFDKRGRELARESLYTDDED